MFSSRETNGSKVESDSKVKVMFYKLPYNVFSFHIKWLYKILYAVGFWLSKKILKERRVGERPLKSS